MSALLEFADAVGSDEPVTVTGGRTQWTVGGPVAPETREVRAPSGIVSHQPSEMIVRVGAGTAVAELDAALAEAGQFVALDPAQPERATVGGVLAVGRSGYRRLRWGPIRDCLLEARYVSAEGRLIKAGAPVVKNVTGFDLCRLLVGSLGTLGLLGEVVLRTQPSPPARQWLSKEGVDPEVVLATLHRPSSVLWDGRRTWVLLEGVSADVVSQRSALGSGWAECDGPPRLPGAGRMSVAPGHVRVTTAHMASGTFVAEIGVGVIHTDEPVAAVPPSDAVVALNAEVKRRFDPTGRLNPGRRP